MGRPTLLDKDQVKSAPYVVAMRDEHLIGASATSSTRAASKTPPPTARYSVIHVEEKLRDPENNDLLGYSGMYVGSGPVATTGDPAKLMLTDSTREALQGDKLFPESVDVNADFVPHAPSSEVDASVIAVRSHTRHGSVPGRRSESRHAARARGRSRARGLSGRRCRARQLFERRPGAGETLVTMPSAARCSCRMNASASSWCSSRSTA